MKSLVSSQNISVLNLWRYFLIQNLSPGASMDPCRCAIQLAPTGITNTNHFNYNGHKLVNSMSIDKQGLTRFSQAFVNYLPEVRTHSCSRNILGFVCIPVYWWFAVMLENSSSSFEPRVIKSCVYLHHSWDIVCVTSCTLLLATVRSHIMCWPYIFFLLFLISPPSLPPPAPIWQPP